MDKELEEKMNEYHSWILPRGTLIHYEGIPYRLCIDTDVFGNTPISEKFIHPDIGVLRDFFEDL